MNELNMVLWGACGGFISALGTLAITQLYWKHIIRKGSSMSIRKMEKEFIKLRIQIVAMQARIGDGE